jgi:hypothetical protein
MTTLWGVGLGMFWTCTFPPELQAVSKRVTMSRIRGVFMVPPFRSLALTTIERP